MNTESTGDKPVFSEMPDTVAKNMAASRAALDHKPKKRYIVWKPITEAKPQFGVYYLVKPNAGRSSVGYLEQSLNKTDGIVHMFKLDAYADLQTATHIAIVTEPGDE